MKSLQYWHAPMGAAIRAKVRLAGSAHLLYYIGFFSHVNALVFYG
jgi:hypothetical protein